MATPATNQPNQPQSQQGQVPSIYDLYPGFKPAFQKINDNANLYAKASTLLGSKNVPDDMRPYLEHFVNTYDSQLQDAYNFSTKNWLIDHPDVKAALTPYINTKLWQGTASALQQYWAWMDTASQSALDQINKMWQKYSWEEAGMMADIAKSKEVQTKWAAAEAQQQSNLAEGLTSRRWFGSAAMWQNAMADIKNTQIENQAKIESASLDKAMAAQSMYNQLLQGLFNDYQSTQDKTTLTKLQTTLNTLNQINQFIANASMPKNQQAVPEGYSPVPSNA